MCSEHALVGMVDVRSEKCCHPICSKQPCFGKAGSKKAETCSQHALDRMVEVANQKVQLSQLLRQGRRSAALEPIRRKRVWNTLPDAMVNVTSRRCAHRNCLKQRSFGMAGSETSEMCPEHAKPWVLSLRGRNRLRASRTASLVASPRVNRGGAVFSRGPGWRLPRGAGADRPTSEPARTPAFPRLLSEGEPLQQVGVVMAAPVATLLVMTKKRWRTGW